MATFQDSLFPKKSHFVLLKSQKVAHTAEKDLRYDQNVVYRFAKSSIRT